MAGPSSSKSAMHRNSCGSHNTHWRRRIGTYEVVLRNELELVKNLRKDDWVAIQHRIEKRARNSSKRSEVIFGGRVVDRQKVAKETRRYRPAGTRRGMTAHSSNCKISIDRLKRGVHLCVTLSVSERRLLCHRGYQHSSTHVAPTWSL